MAEHQQKPKYRELKGGKWGQHPRHNNLETCSIHVKFRQRLSCQGFALFSGKPYVSHFPAWSPPSLEMLGSRCVATSCWNKFLVTAARFLCTFSNHCIFIHLDSTLFTDKNTEDPRGFLICFSHSFTSLARMVSIQCIFCVGHSPSFWRWCDKQDRLNEGPHLFGLPSQSY